MEKNKQPREVLESLFNNASNSLSVSFINDSEVKEKVDYICRCISNRAGIRLLMSCLLAKICNPEIDPCKPYTEIGTDDSFSGRTYDERYITNFVNTHKLPCNPTTAFLTPTLRNINKTLTTETELVGRPKELYQKTLILLESVAKNRINAETLLTEAIRILILMRDENQARMQSLLQDIKRAEGALPLSSEAIVTLIKQHLACKNSSRLPVLIVAASYITAADRIAEKIMPLNGHNAADLQTGSIGDVEVCLEDDDSVVTVYEMKMKRVTADDIDAAVTKIARAKGKIDNYLFITTDKIEPEVEEYAIKFYEQTGGTEIAILDCIGFLKHFLHFFHRLRTKYLNTYQELVLLEPDSSVGQPLKEAFLALRKAAESQ